MDNSTFSKECKERIKKFLIKEFKVNPAVQEVEESCVSLFYIGRAHARAEQLRKKRGQP